MISNGLGLAIDDYLRSEHEVFMFPLATAINWRLLLQQAMQGKCGPHNQLCQYIGASNILYEQVMLG